ncbi:hypothetical protein DS891_08930 [Pseudoalteromonas sp. JC28]|uniref:hypothetical protein n=1 Tax=Pseudoalteromonas sp. JC28 TaxID=2267617 RepID=UPI001573FE49|nr:hypothetical protein [Pseudoalteromonas sp. JC28]NSY33710.1 hypothetical protein [Pseudoalteromonas sp. JC28]
MKTGLNSAENKLVNIVIWLISLYGVAISFFSYFVSKAEYRVGLSLVFLFVSFLILYLGKERIFGDLLLKVVGNKQFDDSLKGGVWHLQISFDDQTRTGNLKFKKSLIGMKVIGESLVDSKTGKVERLGWYAEDAEIIRYNDKEILKYIYKVSGKDNQEKIEKVGIVLASREHGTTNEPFKGIFKDISLKESQISREGTVMLRRTSE